MMGTFHANFSSTRMGDGCIAIDVHKWETILKACKPKDVIVLPEGTFSFPAGYGLQASSSDLTISGASTGKTVICCHLKDADVADPEEETHDGYRINTNRNSSLSAQCRRSLEVRSRFH